MPELNKPVDFSIEDFDTFNSFVTLSDDELELELADVRMRRAMNRDENESR